MPFGSESAWDWISRHLDIPYFPYVTNAFRQ